MVKGTLAAVGAWRMLRAATVAGVDPALLPQIELPPDGGLETRMPYEHVCIFWEKLMRSARDPSLPIRMAETITPTDYDAIGFACATRATFGEALHQAVRFSRIWTDAAKWVLKIDERTATLEFRIDEPHRLGVRMSSEALVAEMIQGGRTLTGVSYAPSVVRFRHAKPDDTSAHERFFRCPIEWAAERTEVSVDASMLETPLLRADPALAAYFERHATALLSRFAAEPDGVEYRLRSALAEELRRGVPTLESIAPRLGMSSRTLRRRLQEAGTSFQEVLDATRCELAKRYLGDPELPVGAVGFMLGFSEPSTFHRAFKRWTGSTPAAFRQSGAAKATA